MKRIILLLLLSGFMGGAQDNQKTINGIISDGKTPLKDVQVAVQGTRDFSFTDAKGRYRINASVGEVLEYTYAGMQTIEVHVEDVTRVLNLNMFPDIEELDEVVVSKGKFKSQKDLRAEFDSNPRLIRTAYGILDPQASAFQVRTLPKNRIQTATPCILDLIRGQFSGVRVNGNCFSGGGITIRGISSLNSGRPAIFDVDGLIFQDTPIWILPDIIERIGVLSSFAATARYGAIASGGVVIINTKAGTAHARAQEIKDKARLRNNVFDGSALAQKHIMEDMPAYYQDLYSSTSLEAARVVYEKYAARYGGSYSFLLDAYAYFSNEWKDYDFAKEIISPKMDVFSENPVALKALAYYYQEQGKFKEAYETLKEVFILRPNYGQSYMDFANSYRDVGNYQRAATMYTRYGHLLEEGFLRSERTTFDQIIQREFNNLLALNGKEILPKRTVKKLLTEEDFNGTRLVFEWNDGEAEFVLQFVNPQGHYYESEHSLSANEDRIKDEKLSGYSCEEYLIDGSQRGTWQVNATYLGNKSLTPSYLKATIYYNYGSMAQRKEVKVFKLSVKNVNQKLFSINHSFPVFAQ